MSRIGKQPIKIPDSVKVEIKDNIINVSGPKGELKFEYKNNISIAVKGNEISLMPKDDKLISKALWGTYRSIISNLVEGVTKGYTKTLSLEGVGFKVKLSGENLEFALGFSHPVVVNAQKGVEFKVEKNKIHISGISKELVGNVASSIRALKKPEPYKGKGIRYEGEVVRRKAGKKVVGSV